jgi:hypothetical protein
VQAGLLGLAALLVGFVLFLMGGQGTFRPLRDPVLLGVVGFVLVHSITESSLNDVSVMLPVVIALGATRLSAPADDALTPRRSQPGSGEL